MQQMSFCQQCGKEEFDFIDSRKWRCRSCGHVLYFNTAGAVAGILEYKDKILLTVREKEPGAGKLDLPGGFIDFNESAEEALSRELKEELGIEIRKERWKYLCSSPNTYPYRGINYHTIDLFYTVPITSEKISPDKKEIRSYRWIARNELASVLNLMAFASVISSFKLYLSLKSVL